MSDPRGNSRNAQATSFGHEPGSDRDPGSEPSRVARLLAAALAEADRAGRPDLQARLGRERTRLATSGCLVAVVGEFKQGKGTLINALLGLRVCGTDPVATTLVPTAVRYAPRPTALLRMGGAAVGSGAARQASFGPSGSDGPEQAPTISTVQALTQADPAGGQLAPPGVTGAEIGIPRRLLASGLFLLDTPGLNGGLSDGRAASTLRAAADADAVVFVSDASQELTAPELELLRRLARAGPAVVLALTKVDVYPHWRRILETDLAHLRRFHLDLPAFPLAAPPRHHALRLGDAGLDAESGYPALAAHLRQEIVGGRRARLERAVADAARDALEQLITELAAERATLADPAGARELRARLEEAELRAKGLSEAAANWRRVLTEGSADMTNRLRDDLERRLRALETAVAERIDTSEPARDWDDLRGWLYRQTNDALLTHRMMIRSEAEALVTTVTRDFEVEVAQPRELLAGAVDRPLAAVAAGRDPLFQRIAGIDLVVQGARGGGVGFMVVSVLGTAAGIAGIAASTMFAPVGLGVLVFLGRRTVGSLRENELRAHRTTALRAASEYLAEARRVAGQDSANTREQIFRALREALTEQAAGLSQSAQRNRAASARAIKVTWDSRQSRLATVEAELARLRAIVEPRPSAGAPDGDW